ncbi:hypothetical protein ABK040_008795 [Willaertia magna]
MLSSAKAVFSSHCSDLSSYSRIPLLKKIVQITDNIFLNNEQYESDRNVLGQSRKDALIKAVLYQNFEDIKDFTEDYYKVLEVAHKRQNLTREFIQLALKNNSGISHQFSSFDCILIEYGITISNLYDRFYVKWAKSVQGNKCAEELEKRKDSIDKELTNSYTIICLNEETNEFYDIPYATYFKEELQPIVEAMDLLIHDLEILLNHQPNDLPIDEVKAYIKYIKQYRNTLVETDKTKLEEMNKELDMLWMDIKYYIQYIHDIEYGYGDVLRCKAIPDFSVRFIDEDYEKVNQFIKTGVQSSMVNYFNKRNTSLGSNGIFAVENSMCAIYCIPFCCGQSVSFRFSGQSIPNRSEVKNVKGVKIYFDPISTQSRIEQTKDLIKKVCANAESLFEYLTAIDTIKNHVAAHELGHAIYNLENVKDTIKVDTKTLLEEPRAELTALSTMKLLYDDKLITREELQRTLVSFAVQDLRRFAMFDKSSIRPYIISAISCYGIYERLGFVSIQNDLLHFNLDKVDDVLNETTLLFESILKAEDERNGEKLEEILKTMKMHCNAVDWLIQKLFTEKQ